MIPIFTSSFAEDAESASRFPLAPERSKPHGRLSARRKLGILILAGIFISTPLVAQWAGAQNASSKVVVRIGGLFFIIAYDSPYEVGVLGGAHQGIIQLITVAGGGLITTSVNFTTSDFVRSHQITSMEWRYNDAGFTLLKTQPSLPYNLTPSSTFTMTLRILAPATSYNGPLEFILSVY